MARKYRIDRIFPDNPYYGKRIDHCIALIQNAHEDASWDAPEVTVEHARKQIDRWASFKVPPNLPESLLWCGFEKGSMVGFFCGQVAHWPHNGSEPHISTLYWYVLPKHRGKLGGDLMDIVKAYVKDKKVDLIVDTNDGNVEREAAMRRMMQAQGFDYLGSKFQFRGNADGNES